MSLTITPVQTPDDLDHIKQLFIEYQNWLNVDLCFQGFENELKNLPAHYDHLILAKQDGEVCGCVGLSPLPETGSCEIKRLYVRPAFQKKGIGRKLALETIHFAKKNDYKSVCLETLKRLDTAIMLYENLGFKCQLPNDGNPDNQIVHMEMLL